mmetsp:Transcript_32407/g.23940  ORF Transcript_32407/g.23940 Transcript_32407/m.23940 type:complete len:96 (+) Transcript_32407:755-1042(+)
MGDESEEEESFHRDEDHARRPSSLLQMGSNKFLEHLEECREEVEILREKYKSMMTIIIANLKRYQKKGVYSYMDEAFTRLNFNNYYLSRDKEGLD